VQVRAGKPADTTSRGRVLKGLPRGRIWPQRAQWPADTTTRGRVLKVVSMVTDPAIQLGPADTTTRGRVLKVVAVGVVVVSTA